jgi:putative transposase
MNYDPHRHHRRSIRLKGYDYSQAGAYFITICCHDRICRFGEIVGAGLAPDHLPPVQNDDMIIGWPQGPAPTMHLNEYGQIAYDEWIKLPERFPHFELDVFQIMPNHMHGIIVLNDVGVGLAPALLRPAQIDDMIKGRPQGHAPTPTAHIDDMQKGRPQGPAPTPTANIDDMQKGRPQGPAPTVGDIVGAYKSLVATGCLTIFKKNNEKMGKLWQRDYYEHIIRDDHSYHTISNYIINNPAKWRGDKFYKQ